MEYETLSGEEITKLLAGKKIRQESKKKSAIKPRPTVPTAGDMAEPEEILSTPSPKTV